MKKSSIGFILLMIMSINIYGEGTSAASIVKVLEESKLSVIKKFVDKGL